MGITYSTNIKSNTWELETHGQNKGPCFGKFCTFTSHNPINGETRVWYELHPNKGKAVLVYECRLNKETSSRNKSLQLKMPSPKYRLSKATVSVIYDNALHKNRFQIANHPFGAYSPYEFLTGLYSLELHNPMFLDSLKSWSLLNLTIDVQSNEQNQESTLNLSYNYFFDLDGSAKAHDIVDKACSYTELAK